MAAIGGQWGEWWTLPRLSPPVQEGGGVAVVSDHDAVLADLSVSELFREGEAEVPCPIGVGGSVLPGSSGADHVKAHLVSFRLNFSHYRHGSPQASVGSGHFARWHTGHGQALPSFDLIVADLLNDGVDHVVVLAIHALSSGCLATLAEFNGSRTVSAVKFHTVESVGSHGDRFELKSL